MVLRGGGCERVVLERLDLQASELPSCAVHCGLADTGDSSMCHSWLPYTASVTGERIRFNILEMPARGWMDYAPLASKVQTR